MAVTQVQNSKANIKKPSVNDIPFNASIPVANSYTAVSTAGQTTIANLGFSVDTTAPASFQLFVDGKLLTLGAANDYTFAAIAADGTSSAIQLNFSLPANLNINAIKLGVKPEREFQTDNRFTQLYEAEGQGFQAFVGTQNVLTATTTVGTPAGGTFYSSIVNRTSMIDLSQDLKARMGVDRIITQQLYQLQNEFGVAGEPVWAHTNDTNQIRFVGNWASQVGSNGVINFNNNFGTDFVEVTFCGTGLNMLTNLSANASRSLVASVDGGTEGSNLLVLASSYNALLAGRNTGTNMVLPIISGLTYGIHTVKIRDAGTAAAFAVYGFEIINTSPNIITNPGVAYISGKKLNLASQSSVAYGAIATGTRGGRLLHYQKTDGTIAQSWTPVNSAPAYLALADHTNEEPARSYNPREFGSGLATDFSSPSLATNQTFNYVLDDGTTNLLGSVVELSNGVVGCTGSSGFIQFTFVGTGLDIQLFSFSAGTQTFTSVTIDGGSSIGSFSLSGNFATTNQKVVSGLPYGTHTVRFTCGSSVSPGIQRFTVYQPKKPTLPSGAVEIADYNVMANYVADTTGFGYSASTGILQKCAVREAIYAGTWSGGVNTVVTDVGGFSMRSATTGDSVQYTFYGTGVEIVARGGTAAVTSQVRIDGSLYTGSATALNGTSWTPGTSTWVMGSSNGTSLQITGLTLGTHTVSITITANASNVLNVNAFNVITPINSQKSIGPLELQNSLSIGSQCISDNRKLTPVKDAGVVTKNISQAVGISVTPSTTSSAFVTMPDMAVNHLSKTGRIKISYSAALNNTGSGGYIQATVDGILVGTPKVSGVVNAYVTASDSFIIQVAPGVREVMLLWYASTGTNLTLSTYRNLIVEDV